MEFQLFKAKCKKCDWEWIPRKPKIYVCPHCHSFMWNEENVTRSNKWHDWKQGVKKND